VNAQGVFVSFYGLQRKGINMAKAMRGFALLTPQKLSEVARKGGMGVPAHKRVFSYNKALAVESGRKGGKNVKKENRIFSRDRAAASRAGRLGGLKTQKNKLAAREKEAV
jgi:general stress protein YciG